jgi:hypothetical protein
MGSALSEAAMPLPLMGSLRRVPGGRPENSKSARKSKMRVVASDPGSCAVKPLRVGMSWGAKRSVTVDLLNGGTLPDSGEMVNGLSFVALLRSCGQRRGGK